MLEKEIQQPVKIEIEKGNTAIIQYDKLIILDRITSKKATIKEHSNSPENSCRAHAVTEMQVNKKNKTRAPIKRTPSLWEGVLKPGMLNFLTNKNLTNASKYRKIEHTYIATSAPLCLSFQSEFKTKIAITRLRDPPPESATPAHKALQRFKATYRRRNGFPIAALTRLPS
ncbi:hypothetical protein EVAR_17778_1 [Eumeta japonica]|uniref:Uncharacterized protein n=1 Tax=Eumeta variegata TaxID=151549 RepID=A0A4C1TTH8_EUMVA|nr:hypothetical protein EVAR_17778_1 [Eumeta japonica]